MKARDVAWISSTFIYKLSAIRLGLLQVSEDIKETMAIHVPYIKIHLSKYISDKKRFITLIIIDSHYSKAIKINYVLADSYNRHHTCLMRVYRHMLLNILHNIC